MVPIKLSEQLLSTVQLPQVAQLHLQALVPPQEFELLVQLSFVAFDQFVHPAQAQVFTV